MSGSSGVPPAGDRGRRGRRVARREGTAPPGTPDVNGSLPDGEVPATTPEEPPAGAPAAEMAAAAEGSAAAEDPRPAGSRRRQRQQRPVAAAPEAPPAFAAADDYADGSAFYRFSAFLGLAAAVVLAASVVVYNTTGEFNKNVLALLIVAIVLGVLYAIPRLDELTGWLGTRTARQGGNATVASVALIGILAVGNWYANRHSPQWDLTAARRYTLSDQTVKILKQLDQGGKDVKVTAFFPSRQEDTFTRGTKDLLRQYQRRSSHFKLEFIDPELQPGVAQQYDIKTYPVTLFQVADRREEQTGLTEQDFTSSLLKVTRAERKKVYFLTGHQERDPGSNQQTGYNAVQEALKRENYDVATLSLLSTQKVPDDAAVVIIAGPRAPLLDPERQAIDDYLNNGGHIFYLADPRQDSGLGSLLDAWQVKLDDDLVIDPGRNYIGDPISPAPLPQSGHRISTSLPDLVLPGARSVTVKQGAGSDFAIAPLLKTTERSWGETTFSNQVSPKLDPGEDPPGPLTVAVAVNKVDPTQAIQPGQAPQPTPTAAEKKPKGRLVVVGNAEFASNTYFSSVLGNRDFFINSVNWLAEDEDLISVRAEPQGDPPIVLTNQSQVLVFYSSVVFVPLAVLLLGGMVWWQRR